MKFIINTSLEPYFCAFEGDEFSVSKVWTEKRKSAEIIWAFLAQHKSIWSEIDFIGGITGPGSFSNLRVTSCVLSALAFKFNLKIHALSSMEFFDFLSQTISPRPIFLLNAYGNRVFVYQSESKKLEMMSSEDFLGENPLLNTASSPCLGKNSLLNTASSPCLGKNSLLGTNSLVCIDFLPSDKKNIFAQKIQNLYDLSALETEKKLGLALQGIKGKKVFVPEYGQSAV